MRRTTYESVADRIEQDLRATSSFPYNSTMDIARAFGISYRTALRAAHVLADRGLVGIAAGKALVPSSEFTGNSQRPTTVSERVYQAIRTGIRDGTYRVGNALPKAEAFRVSHNVSTLTLSRVLRRMAAENLLHKVGNRWFAGPASRPSATPKTTGSDAPVVLLVQDYHDAFFTTIADTFTHGFLTPFANEALAHRFLIKPIQIHGDFREEPAMPVGLENARAIIKHLGPRYLGMLILTVFPTETNIANWIDTLSSFGKPIVFFDSAEKGTHLDRRGGASRRNYYRLHMDEQSAVQLALMGLHKSGHRTIGIHGSERYDWATRRAGIIVNCAEQFDPALQIVISEKGEEIWSPEKRIPRNRPITRAVEELLTSQRSAPVSAAELSTELVAASQSFVSMIRERGITALVAMNDVAAQDYHFWCMAAGMKIPGDLSVVSFDNVFESMFFPVSTVDFGFARLGYLAAHIFIGDIPIHADRYGNIPGVCALVDRGSVARPRTPQQSRALVRRLFTAR